MQIDLSGKYWYFIGIMWIFFGGGTAHMALVDQKLGVMAWLVAAVMTAGGTALCWILREKADDASLTPCPQESTHD